MATLDDTSRSINIQQEIEFHNSSKDTLNQLYLYDWNNAYANKNTALAKRFAEEFDKRLHLAKDWQRGTTKIIAINDQNFKHLEYERLAVDDIIKVQLKHPIYPNHHYKLLLTYTITLPIADFTGYGKNDNGNIYLKYWYLNPLAYEDDWKKYSNLNLDDMYSANTEFHITFNYPKSYKLTSNPNEIAYNNIGNYTQATLDFKQHKNIEVYLQKIKNFETYQTNKITFVTNLEAVNLTYIDKIMSIDKVGQFIGKELNPVENPKILVSAQDYKRNPIYGLNQLPDFLKPFPDKFLFELKLLKTSLNNYLLQTLNADPRKDKWVYDAISNYLLIKYVEENYPDMKLAGSFNRIWGLKSFHFSQMDFNEQYTLYYMLMARKNIDQALSTPRDSLIKFNEKIALRNKAGIGLKYLNEVEQDTLAEQAIKQLMRSDKVSATKFEELLKNNAQTDISWFFNSYVNTNEKIDYKIKSIKENGDSLQVHIKNKRLNDMPISLFSLRNDSVVAKQWLFNITSDSIITIPNLGQDKLALNYDKVIPEYNQRDNWRSTKGFFFNHKPLQLRLFKDAEDPYYNQVFFMPEFMYNFYDGITIGLRLYNKTLIDKPFVYSIKPQFGTKSKSLVGSASFQYRQFMENKKLFLINYGISGSYYHYAPNLVYKSFTPSVSFTFRPEDYRSNKRKILNFRAVNISREKDTLVNLESPNYTVFNARYLDYNNDILNYYSWFIDTQVADQFSKIAVNYEYRKLFDNNRQLNIRLFAGKFIHNNVSNTDYFNFALDRPTDYLFDYNYLGRSENSGIYSQQLIIAEGGFKSKLPYQYANDWMATANVSTNIYRWIEVYGDVGFVKNRNIPTQFVYDSGIRLNLVTDYFELYFPMYSNNGWEVAQPNYAEKIRFVVTLSPRALLGLFTRKWF